MSSFIALIQASCIACSVARVRISQPLAIAILIISLVTASLFARRFWAPRVERVESPIPTSLAARLMNGALVALALAALTWAAWVWLQLLVLAWYREPLAWDSLWYHIPAIHEWAVRGHVAFFPLDPQLASVPNEVLLAGWLNLPMGVELTSFFVWSLLGTSRLVDAGNLWYWPLAFTALAVIAGRLGARGVWRWLAGSLLFGVSLFVAQSVTAYVDPGFGATVMGSVAAALVFVFGGGERRGWKAVLLGANVGLMLGSKGFGLPFAAVIVVVGGVGLLWVGGWRRWRAHLVKLAVCGSVVLAVGGYWYIRNAVNTGNPIYPIQLQIGQKVLIPGYDVSGYDRQEWIVRPVLKPYPPWARMFVAWTQPDAPGRGSQTGQYATAGGLGYIWLLGGLPAVLYLWVLVARCRDGERARTLAFLTLLILLLLGVTTIRWQARYTYWLHALGLPCLAFVLYDAVTDRLRRYRSLTVATLAFGVIGLALWESAGVLDLEWRTGRDPEAATRTAFLSWIQVAHPGLQEAVGFKEFLASDRVARGPWTTTGGLLFGGVLAMPLGQRRISVLAPEPLPQTVSALADDGIEWVFWELEKGAALPEALARCALDVYVHERYDGRAFYWVRLPTEPVAGAKLDADRDPICVTRPDTSG